MLWLKKYGIALILAEVIENPLGNSKILLSGNLVNKVKTLKKERQQNIASFILTFMYYILTKISEKDISMFFPLKFSFWVSLVFLKSFPVI